MARVLIVGNGYVGSHLRDLIREEGFEVEVASRSGGAGVIELDVGDEETVASLAAEREIPDWIVHCASSGRGGPDAYRRVFVEGIGNLTRSFPDSRILFTSSTSVYPQTDGGEVTEDSPANPDRQNARWLREAEDILLQGGGTVLRLAGIYGPGRSIHLQRILAGSAVIESGGVSRWLNQIHRDDAAGAIRHLLSCGDAEFRGEIFNVADDHPVSQRECYETLARMLGKPVPGESPPKRNGKRAWTHKRVSNRKLRDTGWRPVFPSFLGAVEDDPRLLPSIRERL